MPRARVLLFLGSLLVVFLLANCQWNNPSPVFKVQSYLGHSRCVDYTPEVTGSSLFLNDCSLAHPITVQEINERHEVVLHAGNLVIGVRNPQDFLLSIRSSSVSTEAALELQRPANLFTQLSANQIFALDGDSIVLVANRNLVAQVANVRGDIGKPVVLGPRNLADNEFWDIRATDNSDRDPTSGFVRISQIDNFDDVPARTNFLNAVNNAGWGTVIVLDSNVSINLTNVGLIHIPAGVTIRGDRRGTLLGPLLTEF